MDSLIYGKNPTERIISLEVEDNLTTIFVQEEDGSVSKHKSNNRFWVLSNEELNKNFKRMKGDLHYKWGALVETKQEFYQIKNRYGKDKDLFCVYDAKESCMLKDGFTYYKNLKHNEVSVLAFDIETTGLTHDSESKVLIISNTFRDCFGNIERKLFCYDDYINNPADMFLEWAAWINKVNPAIIVGHNIYNFDFPYLDYCASACGIELRLGREERPIKFNNYISKFRKDATQFYDYKKCQIYGREIVDTMFLSIKYDVGRTYNSYGLKSIIKQEGLEVENRQFYDASQIRYQYQNPQEWEKIKAYAEFDADDALSLFDLMAPPFFYLTQSVPKSFQSMTETASGSQINAVMIRAYLQYGHSLPKASSAVKYEGAISLGNPGIFRNVLKVDVASLYPSIMIEYEIYDKEKDPQGYFKYLVKTFTERRLKHKKLAKEDKYYDDLQSAEKIFINSCYGFLGASGLLFNSPSNAALITEKGREILNKSFAWANEKEMQIVNADTDSISISAKNGNPLSKEEQSFLVKDLQKLYTDTIKWEHDGYYPTVIVLKAKNYILFDGEKIKTKGSSLKDQKKEMALKEFCDDTISAIIYNRNNYVDIYNKYVREIMDVKDIKRWSSKKTITERTQSSERTNESKVRDALAGSEYVQSDKIWVFFKSDDSLCLSENFNGDYNKEKLLKKLHSSSKIFANVLPVNDLFLNYSLKRNRNVLQELLSVSQ